MTKHPHFPYPLYLVISRSSCRGRDFLHVAEEAILGGVDIIQLREKDIRLADYLRQARQLKQITDKYKIPLIINDNLEVAIQVNAFGIHVGRTDIAPQEIRTRWPKGHIGYSVEYLEQLDSAEAMAADSFGVSPIFSTPTKTDTVTEWGIEGLKQIRQLTTKPLIAIGNMHVHRVDQVIAAGADSLAVVSAICAADDPQKAAYDLKNKLLKG